MSWFSSILTPSGTSAAQNQQSRQSKVASTSANLYQKSAGLNNHILDALGTLNLGHVFGSALNNFNQDPQANIKQYSAGANENAANTSHQLALALKAQGFNDGAIQGATQGLFQNAATQSNAYAQQQYSPEEQQKRLAALLQSLFGVTGAAGGLSNQYLQGVYGQPQQQVGQSPLGSIAQLAGMFL